MGSPLWEAHNPNKEVDTVQKKKSLSEFLQLESFPEQMDLQEWCEEAGLANLFCEVVLSRQGWHEKW